MQSLIIFTRLILLKLSRLMNQLLNFNLSILQSLYFRMQSIYLIHIFAQNSKPDPFKHKPFIPLILISPRHILHLEFSLEIVKRNCPEQPIKMLLQLNQLSLYSQPVQTLRLR